MTFDLTRDEIWFLKALRAAGERGPRCIAPRRGLCGNLCVVVDDLIGTKATHVSVVGRACCGDHTRTDVLGKLDGDATHTPGAALNEDSLAGPKLKGILDYNQRGETGNCQSGSLDMAKARGFPGDDVGLDSDLLGVRTLLTDIAHGKYRIPGAELCDALAKRADHA